MDPNRYTGFRLQLVDFDGDGGGEMREAIVRLTSATPELRPDRVLVFSLNGRELSQLDLAAIDSRLVPSRIEEITDFDGDGRYDVVFVVDRGFVEVSGSFVPLTGLPLLAHALPDGTFSIDDAVAWEHVEAHCAGAALEALPRRANALLEAIQCAQLMGEDAMGTLLMAEAACESQPDDHDVCALLEPIASWAAQPLPVQRP